MLTDALINKLQCARNLATRACGRPAGCAGCRTFPVLGAVPVDAGAADDHKLTSGVEHSGDCVNAGGARGGNAVLAGGARDGRAVG